MRAAASPRPGPTNSPVPGIEVAGHRLSRVAGHLQGSDRADDAGPHTMKTHAASCRPAIDHDDREMI